ncbi:MAG: hypothetical protein MPI91_08175 [Nitrosopumilus sp.]|nr:hypothetical protein [Nitrosopumilus sp.]
MVTKRFDLAHGGGTGTAVKDDGRPAEGGATELHDSVVYDVLLRLGQELSTYARHGRYDIGGIVEGIAHSYDVHGSHDSAHTIPLM